MMMIETKSLTISPIKEIDYEDICEYGSDEELEKLKVLMNS